jgi:hypothetical protein
MQKLVCEFIHATVKAKFQKFFRYKPLLFSAYSAENANKNAAGAIYQVVLDKRDTVYFVKRRLSDKNLFNR